MIDASTASSRGMRGIAYANGLANGDFRREKTGAHNGVSLSELLAGNLRLQK